MNKYVVAVAALLFSITGRAANENSESINRKDNLTFEIRNSSAKLTINVISSGRVPTEIISQIRRYVRACAESSSRRGFDVQGNWVVQLEWDTFKGLLSGEVKQQIPPSPEDFLKCVNSRFPKKIGRSQSFELT